MYTELEQAREILVEWNRLMLEPNHEDLLKSDTLRAELQYRADMLVTESHNPKVLRRFFAEGGIQTVTVGKKRRPRSPMRKRTKVNLLIAGVVALAIFFIVNTEYFGWDDRGVATSHILIFAAVTIFLIAVFFIDVDDDSSSHHHH